MPHSLILGITESGKTTLGKRLSHEYKKAGVGVIVLDPLCDPEWHADFQTADPDEFLAVFWESRGCAVFIDEAGEAVGRYTDAMHRTATRGRHWGHNCHYLTQRGVQIAPTVRHQCAHLFLFAIGRKDAAVHAEEWNRPQLIQASTLRKGEYFHASRFGDLEKSALW